ncbi:MAG: CpsB/CapC family capsule biosynthesis tyrosine phosphatase [Bacteroidota bacterium]
MGLFNLFNKKKQDGDAIPVYYDVDFHSHLIPGIDDGSKSIEESIDIITFFQSMGVKKMITTPHVSMEYFPNKRDDILERFSRLQEDIAKAGLSVQLEVATEYMIDDGFRALMHQGNLLTFGDNYLLIELGSFAEHPDFSSLIFDLQTSGYNVILAHPERYSFWHSHKDMYTTLKEREVLFQINALSLTNVYSTAVNKTAQWLIENNMIDFIGSDVHHASQKEIYKKAIGSKLFDRLKEKGTIKNNGLL